MGDSVLLFPGQGVQYVGMGKTLYSKYSLAKKIFHEASEYIDFNISKFCFEGNKETMNLTQYTQPTVLTVGYATAKVLMEEYGYEPKYMAGHSLGEITAVATSGGISLEDAVKFVKLRGELMHEAASNVEGAMIAILGIDINIIKQICKEVSNNECIVQISNYNSPVQTVISGHKKAIKVAENRLAKLNAKIIYLNVSAPFHSILMKPATEQVKIALESINFEKMKIPVVSNITGVPYIDMNNIKELWAFQLMQPVEWIKCIKFLQASNITSIVDVGPGNIMKNLAKENCYWFDTISLDKDEEAFEYAIGKSVKEFSIEANGLELIRRCLGIAISEPNNIDNVDEYKRLVISKYELLKTLYHNCLKSNNIQTKDLNLALDLLDSILRNKQGSVEDIKRRTKDLLNEIGYKRED